MKAKNRYYSRSRITEAKFRQIIRFFAMDLTASDTTKLTNISVRSINTDGWRGYDGLVDIGFDKHLRVNHGNNEFACGERHINGIESFWGYAKKRLVKFNGIDKKMLHRHLL